MTDAPASGRLQLRPDGYRTAVDSGTFMLSHHGGTALTGTSAHAWIDRLAPYLDGQHTLAELTDALTPQHRGAVTQLVATLLECGVLREIHEDDQHGLTAAELAEYRPEIGFIGYFRESPQRRFEDYRQATALVYGSGRLQPAVIRALLRSGCRQVYVGSPDPALPREAYETRDATQGIQPLAVAPDTDLRSLLAGTSLLLHVGGEPTSEEARLLDGQCAELGVPILHTLVQNGQVWWSPPCQLVSSSAGWSDGWLRLSAAPEMPVSTGTAEPAEAALTVAANQCVQAAFRFATGLLEPEPNLLIRVDLAELRSSRHAFLPHPLGRPARAETAAEFADRIAALRQGTRLEAEEFSRQAAHAMDSRVGVFDEISEADLAQLPLRVARTTVSDPVGLRVPAAPHPVVFGSALEFATARYQTALAALAAYGALMVDPRRLCTAAGSPLLPAGAEVSEAMAAVRTRALDGYAWAVDLATSGTTLLPAVEAFPALRTAGAIGAPPVGAVAAYSWPEAVQAGLLAHCRRVTMTEAQSSATAFPRVDLRLPPDDPLLEQYLRILAATGERADVYDVTGQLGVPTFAGCLAGRTVGYATAASPAEALRECLHQILLAYQAQANAETQYAPPTGPELPTRLCGDTSRPVPMRAAMTIPEIVAALRRRGLRAFAVPLDHDQEVHRIMPYLVHTVVTNDDN